MSEQANRKSTAAYMMVH